MSHHTFTDVSILCCSTYATETPEKYAFTMLRKLISCKPRFEFIEDPVSMCVYSLDTTKTKLTSTKDSFSNDIVHHMFLDFSFEQVRDSISYEFILEDVSQYNGWVAVGAGDREIINKHRPKWNFREATHGGYYVADNSWVGAHNNVTLNDNTLSFCFGKGDVVRVTYYANTANLEFLKNPAKATRVEYTIPNVPSHARPCVLMLYPGSTVAVRPVKQLK